MNALLSRLLTIVILPNPRVCPTTQPFGPVDYFFLSKQLPSLGLEDATLSWLSHKTTSFSFHSPGKSKIQNLTMVYKGLYDMGICFSNISQIYKTDSLLMCCSLSGMSFPHPFACFFLNLIQISSKMTSPGASQFKIASYP